MASIDDQKFLLQLGQHIRKLREQLDLTQEQLGKKCDLHRAYVGQVERGERNLSLLNLRRIASALRVTIRDLF